MVALSERLSKSVNEKDVENAYRAELLKHFQGGSITSPHNSDGLLEYESIKTLLEFKYDRKLKDSKEQASIFAQVLFYMKKFEQAGQKMPNTIFVGDDEECLALSTNVIDKYLRKQIDWSTAPSQAYKYHPELVNEIELDNEILSYVFDIGVDDFKDVILKIEELANGVINLVPIDQSNIVEAFRYWKDNILNDGTKSTQEEVNIFIKCLIDRNDTYEHPRKKNTLVTTVGEQNVEVKVKMKAHLSFFSHFKREYKPSEREVIVSNKDRLVDEIDRRKTGEFFTPTIWAKEAHKMIAENLGEDWMNEYVVWDCASGTNNLTRDVRFKELYCSTLNKEDIDTAQKMGYNPEATFFQFDFLNDSDDKLPEGLKKALVDGKVLFFINPPYGTGGNINYTDGSERKRGTALTEIRLAMRDEGYGRATEQLYAQFMYKILNYREGNEKIKLGIFSPTTHITGASFNKFRLKWYEKFNFIDGFLLNASSFADVKDSWGISFMLWRVDDSNFRDIKVMVKEVGDGFQIVNKKEKHIYSSDGVRASDWVREKLKKLKTIDVPQLTNPIRVKSKGGGRCVENSLGYFFNSNNSVNTNPISVSIFTTGYSDGHGLSITEKNIDRVVALFTARKTISKNWENNKDEYLVPNEKDFGYGVWNKDAYIYSILQNASNQSSLRNITYKDKQWDIQNEFFFLSNEEMKQLADDNDFLELYNDANHFNSDRHVYNLLVDMELSDDARDVLETARGLVRKSMKYREESHQLRPEYHLQAWDAGFYQVRKGILEHYPELKKELEEFRVKFKVFEDRMREGVYEFGFLKR